MTRDRNLSVKPTAVGQEAEQHIRYSKHMTTAPKILPAITAGQE